MLFHLTEQRTLLQRLQRMTAESDVASDGEQQQHASQQHNPFHVRSSSPADGWAGDDEFLDASEDGALLCAPLRSPDSVLVPSGVVPVEISPSVSPVPLSSTASIATSDDEAAYDDLAPAATSDGGGGGGAAAAAAAIRGFAASERAGGGRRVPTVEQAPLSADVLESLRAMAHQAQTAAAFEASVQKADAMPVASTRSRSTSIVQCCTAAVEAHAAAAQAKATALVAAEAAAAAAAEHAEARVAFERRHVRFRLSVDRGAFGVGAD